MHVNVKILTDYFAIAVDGKEKIEWLFQEAVRRYGEQWNGELKKTVQSSGTKRRLSTSSTSNSTVNNSSSVNNDASTGRDSPSTLPGRITAMRRERDHAVLNKSDLIRDVLKDGDSVVADFNPCVIMSGVQASVQQEEPYPITLRGIIWFLKTTPAEIKLARAFSNQKFEDKVGFGALRQWKSEFDLYIKLDGEHLTMEQLVALGDGKYRIELDPAAAHKVAQSRLIIDDIVSKNKIAYGITTGFGLFASTVIDRLKLKELQISLLRSHAAGVGKPLSLRMTRMLFALRINILARGYSGISLETLEQMVRMFNAFVRAERAALQADVIAALTLDVCMGTVSAFDADVSRVRPHKGQAIVSRRLRALLNNKLFHSELAESHRFCSKVQDAYTLRCCPQVHGIVWDTIDFVRGILLTELNSSTDNPVRFPLYFHVALALRKLHVKIF
ncbi:unnamed protein product [Echinostoma caproni]|uniref:Activating signal cointegrator 1 complex subunit 3 n=1 Tax=Echinostoma caproni TaxID=27848 RepID=A0A183A7H1_9TREM|nr:unnamed protein product [Echinostoma caproni]